MEEFILYKQGSLYPGIVDYNFDPLFSVTGLRASAGIFIFSKDRGKGAVFVDSRYTLAAKKSVDSSAFALEDLSYINVINWIKNNISPQSILLIDPKYFSYNELLLLKKGLPNYSFDNIELSDYFNFQKISRNMKLYRLKTNKIQLVQEWLKKQPIDNYLICNPCFVSWILGIRDLANMGTCAVLGYLLLNKNGEYMLYLDEFYKTNNIPNISTKSMKNLYLDLKKTDGVIGTNYKELAALLHVPNMTDLNCSITSAVKTQEELQDIRLVAKLDSIAFIKFLHWFHTTHEKISELDAVEKLEEFRREFPEYICRSFETIAAADKHAAIVHYTPTKESNTYIDNILLIDAGGQYKNGTTDMTRTVCRHSPTQYQKEIFTLVLKGHIALANSKFPGGTTGTQLDAVTRYPLWQNFFDYGHGTGHGVGYLLNVHEGEQAISKNCNTSIIPDTIMSNEPGYYEENNFGVRLENMIQVSSIKGTNYLRMKTISLIPFDPKFICNTMLTSTEKCWIYDYYNDIKEQLGKYLDGEILNWLVTEYFNYI